MSENNNINPNPNEPERSQLGIAADGASSDIPNQSQNQSSNESSSVATSTTNQSQSYPTYTNQPTTGAGYYQPPTGWSNTNYPTYQNPTTPQPQPSPYSFNYNNNSNNPTANPYSNPYAAPNVIAPAETVSTTPKGKNNQQNNRTLFVGLVIILLVIGVLAGYFIGHLNNNNASTTTTTNAGSVAVQQASTTSNANTTTTSATNNSNSNSTTTSSVANNSNSNNNTATTTSAASNNTTSPTIAPAPPTGDALTVRQVAEKVRPAIVQITNQQNQNPNDPFFGPSDNNGGLVPAGVGSGIIYDKAGYILTNFHVIDSADALTVSLPDGRSFPGTLVGGDQQTDLAVVKIDPKGADLPVAVLGDASQLHVGDGLVAIGNALALPGGPTVTSGVVSALNRSVTEPASQQNNSPFGGTAASGPQLYDLIQTDAAINPGNSGGALVDMYGQVIGINTLVAGQAEPGVQAQGIGFAISINEAKAIAQELVANGKVDHPYLGVSYQILTPAIASQLKLDSATQGDVVLRVVAGSPLSRAGIKRGDVIVSIDGQKISDESTLGEVINKHKSGDKVTLEVISPTANGGNAQTRSIEVTLASRPSNQ
jgi:S1-C subfamily serine protease